MSRLAGLDGASLDAVVIGGGMAGAGVARDLALRGASVALFEKGDFASGTSSKSSKLIHGGLRYLELMDFSLVRESLREKKTLEQLAPHLVRPLPFLVPVYRGASRGLIMVRIGLWLYDLLTPGKSAERSRLLRPVDALSLEPGIRPEDLRGAGYYFDDLLLFPERMCLENVLSAVRHGARAYNYCEVEEVSRGRRGPDGVRVRDLLTGHVHAVRASAIVNCAGPWADRLRELAGMAGARSRVLRTTKGIHCLLPRMTERAVYLSTRDDRMIFVIPWREFSLVGTTDTDFEGDPDRLWATRAEVTYLLEEVAKVLPDRRVALENVAYTYAGVRPLSFEGAATASRVSREHKVIPEGPDGRFLSVTGTKLTCFRSLAEDVGDRVMRLLGRARRSRPWSRPTAAATPGCSSSGASCPTGSSGSVRAIPRSWRSSIRPSAKSWPSRFRTCCSGAPGSARAAVRGSTAPPPSPAAWAGCWHGPRAASTPSSKLSTSMCSAVSASASSNTARAPGRVTRGRGLCYSRRAQSGATEPSPNRNPGETAIRYRGSSEP